MQFTKVTLGLATLALGIASAASSHNITLYNPMTVGDVHLKAGSYTVEMKGDKAVFTSGKKAVEVPATLGTNDQKYKATSLVSNNSNIQEIDLGGTKSKIVFGSSEGKGGSAGQ